ncbi:MAG: ISL3 family transposase, partial [candidate division NC10 bacterium]
MNRVQKQPGFVYGAVRLGQARGTLVIEVEIRPRANHRLTCAGCAQPGPGYDTLAPRRFEFVPLWGIPVFFLYAMRRVQCRTCG